MFNKVRVELGVESAFSESATPSSLSGRIPSDFSTLHFMP